MNKRIELSGLVCHVTQTPNRTYHIKITDGPAKLYEVNAGSLEESRVTIKAFLCKQLDDAFPSDRPIPMHKNVEQAVEKLELAKLHSWRGWISQAKEATLDADELLSAEMKRLQEIERRQYKG